MTLDKRSRKTQEEFQRKTIKGIKKLQKVMNKKSSNKPESDDLSSEISEDEVNIFGENSSSEDGFETPEKSTSFHSKVRGIAYYMDCNVRKFLKNPDCTQICCYNTKRVNKGDLCPNKAVYLCYDNEKDYIELYCQQHYIYLSESGIFEKIYKKKDRKIIPQTAIDLLQVKI